MKKLFVFSILFIIFATVIFFHFGRSYWFPHYLHLKGQRTVRDVIAAYGQSAESRLRPYFQNSNVPYPPEKISLIAFKDKKTLELWAHHSGQSTLVRTYNVLAASGDLGPKLREGDRQVPEGLYKIIGFNPNSSFHLSMKLNYPNGFDLKHARAEGRTSPGTDIFIHGNRVSAGCLAMGDEAIEELFTLSYLMKPANISVIISPSDPDAGPLVPPAGSQPWVSGLYQDIAKEITATRL